MTRSARSSANSYADQFKPAILLGTPTLEQWSGFFYAELLQEQYQSGKQLMMRLGREVSSDPDLCNVSRLVTPVPDFVPNFRQVEISGKKGCQALCVDSGVNQIGVFIYLTRMVDAGGGSVEFHINLKYLPFAMLADLVVGKSKSGLIELKLPDTDIVKLNVTLRPSPALEPEFRTFKTEVLIENLTADDQQLIENGLNFEAANQCAQIGYQLFRASGAWPTAGNAAAMAVDTQSPQQDPPGQPAQKAVLVASATSLGAMSLAFGAWRINPRYGMLGTFFIAAGNAAVMWMDIFRYPPVRPPQPPRND